MASLYPFQQSGVEFLKSNRCVLLADDVGLGKTVQVLKAVEDLKGPVLVVCRMYAREQWADEICTWLPSVSVKNIEICSKAGRHDSEAVQSFFKKQELSFFIIHHEALLKIYNEIRNYGIWSAIVLDEAHRFKNPSAKRTRLLKRIGGLKMYALTATPIEKSAADLWAIFNWFDRTKFKSYWNWFSDFVDFKVNEHGGRTILGTRNTEALAKVTKPYMLRRLKTDVLLDLPEVRLEHVKLPLPDKMRKEYVKLQKETFIDIGKDDGTEVFIFNALQRIAVLRRYVSLPSMLGFNSEPLKLNWLKEFFEDLPFENQVIVFTAFRETAQVIAKALHGCAILGGEPTNLHFVEMFKRGEVRVLTGTYQIMSESLNLQAASVGVFYDTLWSHTDAYQAKGRIDRIGQKTSPLLVYPTIPGTIDDQIMEIQRRKEDEHSLVRLVLSTVLL